MNKICSFYCKRILFYKNEEIKSIISIECRGGGEVDA